MEKKQTANRLRGNMLMIVALSAAIILTIVALGLSIDYFLFSHTLAGNDADRLATNLAVGLNYDDRIGQMNNLVANSRELVFNSRSNYQRIVESCPMLTPLGDQLLSESRDGADLVEKGRRGLVQLIVQDLQTSAKSGSATLVQNVALPWAASNRPEVLGLRVGTIKGVESNVSAPYGNDSLLSLDTKYGYIDPSSHLYYGCRVLKLPEDPDKQFRITSLPAPVQGNVSPARLTTPQVFEKSADLLKDGQPTGSLCDQLPTAVQVLLGMNITNRVVVEKTQATTVDSTATTSGGKPMPFAP
jgi:hypothetical protein